MLVTKTWTSVVVGCGFVGLVAAGCGGGGGSSDAAGGGADGPIGGADGASGWVPYVSGDLPRASIEGVVMLSNFTQVTRAGATWSLGATSVAANVIHADDAVLSRFSRSDASDCVVYEGVTNWTSRMGLTPITVASSESQSYTATWNGTSYAVSGLVGGAAFGVDENVDVTAPAFSQHLEGPQAPPFADANDHLGAAAGLATVFSMPDAASFDLMFTFVAGTGTSAGGGEYGAMCERTKADLALADGDRSAPLVDAAAIARLTDLGITPTTVNVAVYRTADVSGAFVEHEPINLQVGQMLTIPAATLAP